MAKLKLPISSSLPPWLRFLTNRYVVITLIFAVWMTFLDIHSCQVHREIDKEIYEAKQSINYYQSEIARDQERLQELESQSEELEKFAREQYFLRKENEEIYLIKERKR